MNINKSIFLSQQIIAMKESDIFNPEIRGKLMETKIYKTVLPGPFTIYDKEIVKDQTSLLCGNINFNLKLTTNMNVNHLKPEERVTLEEFSSKSTAAESTISSGEFQFSNLREADNSNSNSENVPDSINCLINNTNYNNFSENNQNKSHTINSVTASTPNKLFRSREKSRFNFVKENFNSNLNSLDNINLAIFNSCESTNSLNTTQDSQVEIPNFVNDLIYKKVSRFSFFKNFAKDDQDFTYFDSNLIREYTENNPWALFIINGMPNKSTLHKDLKSLIEKEQLEYLKKFNSA
jgi:hypothetical protein